MMKRICLAAILLLGLGMGCDRKTAPSGPAPGSPVASPAAWKESSHPAGKFCVLMPGTPQEQSQDLDTAVGKLKMTMLLAEIKPRDMGFAAMFADYPAGPNYSEEKFAHQVLDGVVGGITKAAKGPTLSKSKIRLGAHHGQEFVALGADGRKRMGRVYLVRNRLYQLLTVYSDGKGDNTAEAEKFLQSFKIQE